MGATQAPPDQVIAALAMAGEVKRKRPLLLAHVRTGNVPRNLCYAADATEDTPELLAGMAVFNFLVAVEGVEDEQAEDWMEQVEISPMANMRALSGKQRIRLAGKLRMVADAEAENAA